jgi:ribosome-associated protein
MEMIALATGCRPVSHSCDPTDWSDWSDLSDLFDSVGSVHPPYFPRSKAPIMSGIHVNERLHIPEEQLQWSFSRSSGPGGQNVNKVNTKATLRWQPAEGTLPSPVWNRFRTLAKRYLTTEGEVVIQSQQFRDQAQNVQACRTRLAELLRQASVAPKRRIKTKPSKAAKRRRLDEKKRISEKKKSRRSKDW